MLDRVTGMEVFARVAGLGSFSAAARALGLSQTMVTKHVAALEERLGVRLLHRTTRRLSLTEAGRNFLDSCLRLLPEIEEAERAVSADRLESRGLLRLNVPVSFGTRHVAPLLGAFGRLHPRVTVELGLNDRLVDLVEEGWDLAIRIRRLGDSSLVARRLAPVRMIVCGAPSYLEARGIPARVEELRRHACLGYTLSEAVGAERWVFGTRGEVSVPVGGSLRANNGDALREAAIAGQGLIYQPVFLLDEALRDGRLVGIALDHPPMGWLGIHAVQPPLPAGVGRQAPAKTRAMVDFLARAWVPEPPWERNLPPPVTASGPSD